MAIRGEASPQALAQASGLAHRRSPNALGSNERSLKWQRNFSGAYVCKRSAFSFFFGLSGRLGTARRVVRGWITLMRRQQGWRTLATGALKRWIRACGGRLERRGLPSRFEAHCSPSRKLRRLSTSKDERQAYRRLVRRGMFAKVPAHADQVRTWV